VTIGATTVLALTVTLRTGATVAGDIVRMDDTNLVLKTAAGEAIFAWRELSNESIKQANPELYNRLLAQAKQRQRAAAADRPTAATDERTTLEGELARMRRRVMKRESRGRYENVRTSDTSTIAERKCWGVVCISIDGLDRTKIYKMQTRYKPYLAIAAKDSTITPPRLPERTEQTTLAKKTTFTAEYDTDVYKELKETLRSGIRYTSGGRVSSLGLDIVGWDIQITINDVPVYEEKNGCAPQYHFVHD